MLWWVSVAPLGKPVVPLVYWMLIGSSEDSSAMREAIASRSASPAQNSPHSGRSTKTVRSSVSTAPAHLVDHGRVVARLERAGAEQQPHARLAQHVLELVRAVGGVDVDEDRADLGRRVLHEHPLGAVGRPDADAVARADPEMQQPGRRGVDRRVELAHR